MAAKKKKLTWGGARPGAGRPRIPESERRFAAHRPRPEHDGDVPLLITIHVLPGVPSMLKPKIAAIVLSSLRLQRDKLKEAEVTSFRVLRFGLEAARVYLLVEADDRVALTRGMMGFMIRAARALNPELGRKGRLWGDRYHAEPLTTPADVRRAARKLEALR